MFEIEAQADPWGDVVREAVEIEASTFVIGFSAWRNNRRIGPVCGAQERGHIGARHGVDGGDREGIFEAVEEIHVTEYEGSYRA